MEEFDVASGRSRRLGNLEFCPDTTLRVSACNGLVPICLRINCRRPTGSVANSVRGQSEICGRSVVSSEFYAAMPNMV